MSGDLKRVCLICHTAFPKIIPRSTEMKLQLVLCMAILTVIIIHIKFTTGTGMHKSIKIKKSKNKRVDVHLHKTECYEFLLCNKTTNYPESSIRKLLRKNKKLYAHNKMFGTVIEPGENTIIPSTREGTLLKEKNFCETRKVTVFPKVAYDVKLQQKFIVNIKGYEQSVSFETCIQENCFNAELPLNYKTRCKQLYNIVRLLHYTDKGALEYGKFTVPSTCVCKYTKEFF